MTARQAALLRFLETRQTTSDEAPSFDEMRSALGLRSKSGIHRLLTALEAQGRIVRSRYRARCINVVQPDLPVTLAELQAFAQRLVAHEGPERARAAAAGIVPQLRAA